MLSASGASRWLACPPSARLEQEFPSSESIFADEGTLAHELSEWLIRHVAFGINIDKKLSEIQENELYNDEMYEYCMEFAIFVVDKVRNGPPGTILLQEQLFDLTEFIPEGFGTTDVNIIAESLLEIVDLKYGKGVPVDAFENKQMMTYALGAYEEFKLIYPIEEVRMTIYQPRIDNISSHVMPIKDLLKWGRTILKPGAIKAYNGEGEFFPGDHCKFCRARATCKALAKRNLQIAARDFDPATLPDEQIVKILAHADRIKNWLKSVEDYALQAAIEGRKWPGMKVVQGRSVRKITDEQAVFTKLLEAGYKEEDLVKKKLPGITHLQKVVSKLHMKEIVEPLLVKPPGSPTLVPESDKRPEWNSIEAAAADFSPVED